MSAETSPPAAAEQPSPPPQPGEYRQHYALDQDGNKVPVTFRVLAKRKPKAPKQKPKR